MSRMEPVLYWPVVSIPSFLSIDMQNKYHLAYRMWWLYLFTTLPHKLSYVDLSTQKKKV